MPGCNQTLSGLARDCAPNKGGILEVLLNYADSIDTVTITDGMISAITLKNTEKFKAYQLRKNMGSLSKSLQVTDGGNRYVTVNINMNWPRMDTAKRTEAAAIADNQCVAIVKDANGKYWYVGYSEPVHAAPSESGTGAAIGDTNQYALALTCDEDTFPYEVDPSIIAGLKA